MIKRIVSGLYRLAVTVVAVVGCIGLMQVPQPWRGMLVLWLCGTGAVGALVFLALRQHHDFKAMQWQRGAGRSTPRRRAARHALARSNGLRVITSQGASRVQHIVR